MADIAERARKIITEHLDAEPAKVTDAAGLLELGADSLDQIEIVMSLEQEFDIEIEDDDADRMKTVGDAIALVSKLVAA
jgi:acyl carrier protein